MTSQQTCKAWRAAPTVAFIAACGLTLVALSLGSPGRETVATRLLIESSPPGASVFLDGSFQGLAPCEVPTFPGRHAMRLEMAGFKTSARSVEVGSGPNLLRFELTPEETGCVRISSKPSGAEVFLDGQFAGVTPLKLDGVPAGDHVLRVEKANYSPSTLTAFVESGQTLDISCQLEDRMLEYLKNAVEEFPEEIYRYMELGHYYFLAGEPELAAETYGKGLALAQDEGADRTQREKLERQIRKDMSQGGAIGERFKSRMERVMRELSVQRLPKRAAKVLQEAREKERDGRPEVAADLLEQALKELPENLVLREELARLRIVCGQLQPATAALREFFRRSPTDSIARKRLAEEAFNAAGRYEEDSRRELFRLLAEELARTRGNWPPDELASMWEILYRLEVGASRMREAAAALASAAGLQKDPLKRSRMELELARLYASLGRYDESRAVLQRLATTASEPSTREEARAELAKLPQQ